MPLARRGAVALRPLGAAEVLDGAVRIVRRNPRAAFGFALPIAVAQAVLGALVLVASNDAPALGTVANLLRLVVSVSAGTVLSGLLAPVVLSDALGTPITPGEAWRRARGASGVLLLIVLGVGVALVETVGLVLAVVGGIWLWGVWSVVGPAMAVERIGVLTAVRRSYRLAGRAFWRAWGVRALGWVVAEVLGLLIVLPVEAVAAYVGQISFGRTTGDLVHPALFITIITLGQLLSFALVAPFSAAVDGLIYFDLRMRVEGLDLVIAADRSPSPVPAGPAVTAK